MSEGLAVGGHSTNQSLASRAGQRELPRRISAPSELEPLHSPPFDARDFAVNSFVILFFSLVFFAPLLILGAVVFRLK